MKRRWGWAAVRDLFRRREPARKAARRSVPERRSGETAVVVFMIVLFGLGVVGSLLGGMAAGDASRFWQNFVGGVALLALMTLPIWFLQRWQAVSRPARSPRRVREARRIRLLLLALWLLGLSIASVGLAINVRERASVEADLAVGLLIVYLAGWGLLVFRVLGGLPSPLGLMRARRLESKTK